MAKVLESLSGPLSCGTRSSLSGPVLCHKSLLPACNGLRIQTRAHRLTLAWSSSSRRRISATTTTRAFPRGIVCEAQDTAVDVAAVTDATWKSLVLENDLPTLVEFWAPWCGPCRMIHPIIDELSKQYAGKLKCLKLNTDESPSVATQYGIRSIPTVMIFKSGEKKDTIIGAVPKSTLTASIDKFL